MSAETLDRLNSEPPSQFEIEMLSCCGSEEWARRMALRRPFESTEQMADAAEEVWQGLTRNDWLEAFAAHPRIGQRNGARRQSERAATWSVREQAGTHIADAATRAQLARVNEEYEQKFGYTFIVFATGKSAGEMLRIALGRLSNDPETELGIAANEQGKIMRLRIQKLVSE
jgi:OHCU decarboxylase